MLSNGGQQRALAAIEIACEDAQPPLAHLRHVLHIPVNFWIMPVFALANAGVTFGGSEPSSPSLIGPVSLGVTIGLVLGKPLGILLSAWIATRFGATLPTGATWGSLTGVACLAGIGFTMSLFVSGLAFPGSLLMEQAKLGIVLASITAGVLGAIILLRATRPSLANPPHASTTHAS